MKELINKIISSLDTHSTGFSARKLSAFAVMLSVLTAHVAWLKKAFTTGDFSQLQGVLTIDYAFIAACLTLTTFGPAKPKQPDATSNESTPTDTK